MESLIPLLIAASVALLVWFVSGVTRALNNVEKRKLQERL
jgi:hypothetical protein